MVYRLIRKNGHANVKFDAKKRNFLFRFILDPFTTITNWSWTQLIVFFLLTTIISWLLFAFFWSLITLSFNNTCFLADNIQSIWLSSILYSIETQQTIGYGSRAIKEDCHLGIVLLMLQSAFAIIYQAFMGGLFFAKLSLPRKRSSTIIFSNNAVLATRDAHPCLMCRVCDMQQNTSHIVQATFKMYLLQTRLTSEGEVIPWSSQELKLTNGRIQNMLYLPIILEHPIDSRSPLYALMTTYNSTYEFLTQADFEILVTIQGTIDTTGASLHKQTSYTPDEIYADHYFVPMIDNTSSKAKIDMTKLHSIIAFEKFREYMADDTSRRRVIKLVDTIKSEETHNFV